MKGAFVLNRILLCLFLSITILLAARTWKEGTLLSSERQETDSVVTRKETNHSKDAKGNDQAKSTTTTSTIPTVYMLYTITDGTRTYVARQGTTIWETKVKAQPNDKVQFAVEGDTLYIRRDDGKESKMKVIKVTSAKSTSAPQ